MNLTDEQFIALWMELRGAQKLANVTGVSLRNVQRRRARIQEAYQIILPSDHEKAYYKLTIPHDKIRLDVQMNEGSFIVFSDAHFWPNIESTAFKAMLKLIPEIKPKMVIANGDIFDGAMISRHDRIGFEKRPTVKEELDATVEAMGKVEAACKGYGTKFIRTIGNHDIRFDSKIANELPAYEGVPGMSLDDHLPFWTSGWSCMINEKSTHPIIVKHRWHNGIHATYNNTLKGGISIFTGHLHALGITRFSDYKGTRYGVDTGTLANPWGPQFNYMEDNSRNWRSGFAVGTIHDNVLMPPEFCEITGNIAWWRGRVIDTGDDLE